MSRLGRARPQRQILTRSAVLETAFGELAGSTSIAFSETAALGSLSAIAASESIDFSETAVLGSLSSIAGNTSIDFSETAAPDAIAFGDIVGDASIDFSELAALDGFVFGDVAATAIITFSENAGLDFTGSAPVQPVLPVLIPTFRTIDAKTLADNFNRGQIREPDYEWPNRRKFYQDDSPG